MGLVLEHLINDNENISTLVMYNLYVINFDIHTVKLISNFSLRPNNCNHAEDIITKDEPLFIERTLVPL